MTFNRGLMVLMTFERWVVICRPLTSMRKFKQTFRIFTLFALLAVWSLLLGAPRAWENVLVENKIKSASKETWYGIVTRPDYACNRYYQYLYNAGVLIGLNIFLPIVVMAALNGMAIYVLMKSREALGVS